MFHVHFSVVGEKNYEGIVVQSKVLRLRSQACNRFPRTLHSTSFVPYAPQLHQSLAILIYFATCKSLQGEIFLPVAIWAPEFCLRAPLIATSRLCQKPGVEC